MDEKKIVRKTVRENAPSAPTVGKIATDLMQKEAPTRDPIELEREMHKDYEANVYECVERSKKEYEGDFFIVVLTKKERLLQNVLRNYLFGRKSCPTPQYDQTVYRYDRKDDCLSHVWTVPSKDTCKLFLDNILLITDSERELLNNILDFETGTLLEVAKKFNQEETYA